MNDERPRKLSGAVFVSAPLAVDAIVAVMGTYIEHADGGVKRERGAEMFSAYDQ